MRLVAQPQGTTARFEEGSDMPYTILQEMLSIPTAPFAEHLVIDYVRSFCEKRKAVTMTQDSAGNVLVRVRKGTRRVARPVCITAHLDHPGFIADKMTARTRVRAHWRGGVQKAYFVGTRVRFWLDDKWVKGTIKSVKLTGKGAQARVATASIDVPREIPPGTLAMWDLPEPKIRGDRIHARACDDIAGAAAMLECVDRLSRGRQSCDAYFLFTRAEEVGFVGAMAAVRRTTIPTRCYVVAMETSSELPSARMGDGPILRVGDRMTTFTSEVTSHCGRIAADLAKTDKKFIYQRKLMDGGMCESTAYCLLGYEATGMCVALGNYHNMNTKRKVIAPEYINLRDYDNTVKWFIALATTSQKYTGKEEALRARLKKVEKDQNPAPSPHRPQAGVERGSGLIKCQRHFTATSTLQRARCREVALTFDET